MTQRVQTEPKTQHTSRAAKVAQPTAQRAQPKPARQLVVPKNPLKEGSHGAEVANLQRELKHHGCNPGPIDGQFGPHTKAAVKAFQEKHGMSADGIASPRVWKALGGERGVIPGGALREGSHGQHVKDLQRELKQAGFNPGAIDGQFGPHTKAAVESFQRARGLQADGVAGHHTWNALSGDRYIGVHSRGPSGSRGAGGGASVRSIGGSARSQMSALMREANAMSGGKRPEGYCLGAVQNMLARVHYGNAGAIPRFPYAHDFADFLNRDGNAAKYGLKRLNINNPYEAPPGSIVVVRAGTPGTHNPVAGDIVVSMGGGRFLNDGEMGYGGSGNFYPGNNYVLGVYAPA